jgi:hypothetical protein
MATDVKLQSVYDRVKSLKDRFYATKNQEEWEECKKELIPLLDEAKTLMTPDFYPKYKQGVVDSIAKMWAFKEKYFQQQGQKKVFPAKQSYIFREGAESEAFVKLCNTISQFLQTKMSLSDLA